MRLAELSPSGIMVAQPVSPQPGHTPAVDPLNEPLPARVPPPALPIPPGGPSLDAPLQDRLQQFLSVHGGDDLRQQAPPLPPGFQPWWQRALLQPQRRQQPNHPLELDELLFAALQHSPQVHAIRETDLIRSTAIVEAEAEFDWKAFMESKFVRTSDPVGDDLTTGGPPRFRDSTWYYLAGARRKNQLGGTAELSQRIGYRDNNSIFLNPTQQGNARLSLAFTQPLLNGAGRTYNQSRIVLANLDTRIAEDEVVEGLQEHLVEVTEAYWDLYLRRAVFEQKKRHQTRAAEILRRLEDRREVDSIQSQILSARAAVAIRGADLNRAAMAIRNAESRIRVLVSAPELFAQGPAEFLPATPMVNSSGDVSLHNALATALHHRPDVDVALQTVRMAGIRLNMSEKELLPVLNLVLETYVAGLEGRSNVGQAWQNQFSVGEPGYTAGLIFEVPLHNRAARARHQRRHAELRQVSSEMRAIVDAALLEVEIAVRTAITAYGDMAAYYRSMEATEAEVRYLHDRWTQLPGDDRSASFLLEDLLNAQNRLADAEFAFAQAQVAHALAHVQLKKAMGVLMAVEPLHSPTSGPAPASGLSATISRLPKP